MAEPIIKKRGEMNISQSKAKKSKNPGWHHAEVYLPLTIDFQVDQNGYSKCKVCFRNTGLWLKIQTRLRIFQKLNGSVLPLEPGQASQHASPCPTAKAFDLEISYSTHHPDEKYHTWSIIQATFQYLKEGIF